MTTVQKATLAVLATGLAAILIYQHRTHDRLNGENEALRARLVRQSQLEAENERLTSALATATAARTKGASPSRDQLNELLRLRGEVGLLRQQEREWKARLAEQELGEDPTVVARIKLPFAEAELTRITQLHDQKLVSDDQILEAQYHVALLNAEARGDRAEAARLRLQQADESLTRISELHAQNLVDETSLARAKQEVELCRAEQSGDRSEVWRTRLRHAEEGLSKLRLLSEQKLIGDAELNRAAMEVELIRASGGSR